MRRNGEREEGRKDKLEKYLPPFLLSPFLLP
jgi:hypothetical protein